MRSSDSRGALPDEQNPSQRLGGCKQRRSSPTPHSITSSASASRVGGTSKPSALACLEVDHEFKFNRCLCRQVGRLCALKNAIVIGGGAPPRTGFMCRREGTLLCAQRDNGQLHSMTSSASCWSCAGISRPSVAAVFRLITRSNLSGRCIGSSLGFVPCRTLPTYSPHLRNISLTFGP